MINESAAAGTRRRWKLSVKDPLVFRRCINVEKRTVYLHGNLYRVSQMSVDHRLCPTVWFGAPQLIKDSAIKDHRMPMPSVLDRPDNRRTGSLVCVPQSRHSLDIDQWHIDQGDKNPAHTRPVNSPQPDK
jgi:hypothetical protein